MAVYRGFSFPFGTDGATFPAEAEDDDLIADSVRQVVETPRGTRLMRAAFGTRAYSYVFENNDALLVENLRTDVMGALGRYEPRILVTAIDVTRNDSEILLIIRYVVRATRREQSLTMPLSSN
jgi:phage baseplate assembly protein W